MRVNKCLVPNIAAGLVLLLGASPAWAAQNTSGCKRCLVEFAEKQKIAPREGAYEAYVGVIRNLKALGAQLSERAAFGKTSLYFAIVAGNGPLVQALLDEGADPNEPCDVEGGRPSLVIASDAPSTPEIVMKLIRAGARLEEEISPLVLAANLHGRPRYSTAANWEATPEGDAFKRERRIEIVKLLLSLGADPNAGTPGSRGDAKCVNPLLTSLVERDSTELAGLLLASGADAARKDCYGKTALHYSWGNKFYSGLIGDLEKGDPENAFLLATERGGVDDMERLMPVVGPKTLEAGLLVAADIGSAEKASFLLDQGVDVKSYDGLGSALVHAKNSGSSEIVELLEKRGARACTDCP